MMLWSTSRPRAGRQQPSPSATTSVHPATRSLHLPLYGIGHHTSTSPVPSREARHGMTLRMEHFAQMAERLGFPFTAFRGRDWLFARRQEPSSMHLVMCPIRGHGLSSLSDVSYRVINESPTSILETIYRSSRLLCMSWYFVSNKTARICYQWFKRSFRVISKVPSMQLSTHQCCDAMGSPSYCTACIHPLQALHHSLVQQSTRRCTPIPTGTLEDNACISFLKGMAYQALDLVYTYVMSGSLCHIVQQVLLFWLIGSSRCPRRTCLAFDDPQVWFVWIPQDELPQDFVALSCNNLPEIRSWKQSDMIVVYECGIFCWNVVCDGRSSLLLEAGDGCWWCAIGELTMV